MTRHAFDAVSFAFGVILLIAGVMLLNGRPNTDALALIGPVTAIGLGVVILVATVPRRRPAETGADDAPPDGEPMGDADQA
ncbi:MAG TPA: hypothetical protein VIC83_08765 [Candidatus Limnocylindria bacterium]|jgi:hypothetical protein